MQIKTTLQNYKVVYTTVEVPSEKSKDPLLHYTEMDVCNWLVVLLID